MTTITAALIQTEFGVETATATLEAIINSCIDAVNTDANLTIAQLSGSPGSVTVTAAQASAIKPLIGLKLSANATSGGSSSSISVSAISMSQTASNNANSNLYAQQYRQAIAKLRSPPIYIANSTITTT
jgi:hypothetical protein